MIEIYYTAKFSKILNKISQNNPALFDEIVEKIEDFKNLKNHKRLKVHKLHGEMKKLHSFSIDYKNRIVFKYLDKQTAILLVFGDHQIYQ